MMMMMMMVTFRRSLGHSSQGLIEPERSPYGASGLGAFFCNFVAV